MKRKPVLGLFHGEATGIGPEITAKVLDKNRFDDFQIIICGAQESFKQGMKIAGVNIDYNLYTDFNEIKYGDGLIFYQIDGLKPEDYKLATINRKSGKYTGKVMAELIKLAIKRKIDGVIYAPLNKEALYKGGYHFNDEISYYANLMGWEDIYGELNCFNGLWAARVTSHIGINDISKNVNRFNIIKAIKLAQQTLERTGNKTPSIAIAALNPHAGDGGLFGKEEIEIIEPAIKEARELGYNVHGPYPADTIFIKAYKENYDVVISMYHDQAQIALKLKGFDRGVTVSGGLP